MEIREVLTEFGFDGDETPIIYGSALCALEDKKPEMGIDKIKELIEVCSDLEITVNNLCGKDIFLRYLA